MESHLFKASTQESRQRELCEFKPNLVSKVSSRSGQRELHSERLFPRQQEEKDSVIRSLLKPTHQATDTSCIRPPCTHSCPPAVLFSPWCFLVHTARASGNVRGSHTSPPCPPHLSSYYKAAFSYSGFTMSFISLCPRGTDSTYSTASATCLLVQSPIGQKPNMGWEWRHMPLNRRQRQADLLV